MKRITAALLALILLLTLAAGCSSGSGTTGRETGETDSPAVSLPERTINGSLRYFSAQTLDGQRFTPSSFKGYDITVINFWGTYCGPCIAEMPELAEFYDNLPAGVNFITYCVDAAGNKDSARRILNDAGLKAPVITYADTDFANVLNQIQYIPTTIFVDSEGNLTGSEIIGGVHDVIAEYNLHIEQALSE